MKDIRQNTFSRTNVPPRRVAPWPKAIPESRDRLQSDLLTGALATLLTAKAAIELLGIFRAAPLPRWFLLSCCASLGFALVVWLLRAATGPAAAMGGLVCVHVLLRQQLGLKWTDTAMPALLALFLLTYAATKFGRRRKEAMGTAEERHGRRASQVLANLGVAGLFAAGGTPGSPAAAAMFAACIAALAEATADTVSSEVGQALARSKSGRTLLITTGKTVPPGTDGGISVAGTASGLLAAAVIVMLSSVVREPRLALAVFGAAGGGLLFDSLLGATVERRGLIGNDVVNLSSTIFAAAVGFAAALALPALR